MNFVTTRGELNTDLNGASPHARNKVSFVKTFPHYLLLSIARWYGLLIAFNFQRPPESNPVDASADDLCLITEISNRGPPIQS